MTMLFIEGFEIYGSDEEQLTDGVFLEERNVALNTSVVRTGTYSLATGGVQAVEIRRALYGEYLTLGMAFGMYLTELPVETYTARICEFRNDDNTPQISVWVTAAGNISVGRGGVDVGQSYTEIARTITSPVITDAWQHFEIQVHLDDTEGWFEVRLDGLTILQATGADTIGSTVLKNCNQVLGMGTRDVISGGNINWLQYMDDWYCYSVGEGTENNDWVGDRRVLPLFPNDNGPDQDWTPNGASTEYDCIDDNPADDDTTYLEVDDTSLPANCNFELENVPSYVGAIAGVDVYVKSKKTDAGECNLVVSMQRGSDEISGNEHPISTIYAHRTFMFELDPQTGALWTPEGLNEALIDIERTA